MYKQWKCTGGSVYTEDGKPICDMRRDASATEAGIDPCERDSNAKAIALLPEFIQLCEKIAVRGAASKHGLDASSKLTDADDICSELLRLIKKVNEQ